MGTSAANQIRIADLREPRRSGDELRVFEIAKAMQIDLAPSRLVDAARWRTGLDDFGDPTVLDRLTAQIATVETDEGLSGLGRYLIKRRLVGLLSARLRFEDFVKRYPEALATQVEAPIIVVGLPRSGTTHLVNLLATDTRLRSLPWWEAAEPIPVLGDGPAANGIDQRYLRCEADYLASKKISPLTSLMHDRHPSSIEEECELLDLDLCTYVLEWHARVPAWRDYADQLDQVGHYSFLRRQLQVLSYLRGPRRWVLKCPQHLERLDALMTTFPDATIAFTLRDPVAVLQSAVTMLAYGDRHRRLHVDADELVAYWTDRIEGLLRCSLRDVGVIPNTQRVDVEFDEFMSDDVGMATRILQTAGLPVNDEVRHQFATYVEGHPRGRDGRVAYDLRNDFGVDPADLYERFAFYFEAFPQIRKEVG